MPLDVHSAVGSLVRAEFARSHRPCPQPKAPAADETSAADRAGTSVPIAPEGAKVVASAVRPGLAVLFMSGVFGRLRRLTRRRTSPARFPRRSAAGPTTRARRTGRWRGSQPR